MGSRMDDLAHVEARIEALGQEAKSVQERYQKYHSQVQQRIREVLEEHNLWDEIHGLEATRAEASQKAQAKLQGLNQEAQDLQKVRAFLLGRQAEEEEPVVEDPPAIEVEEVTDMPDLPVSELPAETKPAAKKEDLTPPSF